MTDNGQACHSDIEKNEEYERFLKERSMLFENQKEQANLFDKNILYISAGAFAVTPVYLEKFFKAENICGRELIYISMILFGISIVSTLWAFFASARCSKAYLEQLDRCWIESGEIVDSYRSHWKKSASVFNWTAVGAFSLAMLLVSLFFIVN